MRQASCEALSVLMGSAALLSQKTVDEYASRGMLGHAAKIIMFRLNIC